MADFGEQVKQGIAPSSESVILSAQADKDLEGLGPITRRLLERTVRDELLSPASTAAFEPLSLRGQATDLFAVPVGRYRAVFRPLDDPEKGEERRFVERIVSSDDVESSLIDLIEDDAPATAEAAPAEAQPSAAEPAS